MEIIIKGTVDLTPPLRTYIQKKLAPLVKFIPQFDGTGEAEIRLEVSRTTHHHRKGPVFFAAADLRLPHKILRAEGYAEDIRKAIDQVRDTLRLEIEKYKTRITEPRRGR